CVVGVPHRRVIRIHLLPGRALRPRRTRARPVPACHQNPPPARQGITSSCCTRWALLEMTWMGRTVRLKEDILNLREPEGRRLYVQAGTSGTIVALNRDEYAPFTVRFPDFPYKVKVRLDKLDVL